MTIGRRVVNVTQKARGKEPIKYELEVIPYTAWEIPPEYDRLLFAWERGSKLFVTDAETVRPNRSVVWRQFLKQTATMYRGPDGFEAKDFAFKLQSVKTNAKGGEERKTVAKVHIDLSTYCTGQVNPQPVEKTLTLKPFGKLKVSIRASWLKDAKLDPDAMTEVTVTSYGRQGEDSMQEEDYYDEQEQDLSGFAGGEGQEEGASHHQPRKSSRSRNGRPRSKHRSRAQQDDIPEGSEEVEEPPGYERRRQHERRPKVQQDSNGNDMDAPSQVHLEEDLEAGLRIQKKTWKDYICCCLEPKIVTAQPMEVQEGQELLSTRQKVRRSDRM